jgi:hypothetical protein
MSDRYPHCAATLLTLAVVLLAAPVLGVHAWMAWTFPSYLHGSFGQDVVFTFALCALLVTVARLRLLHLLSVPLALLVYLGWLFLVLGEGVSYYLQADTFNARFFANLHVTNLTTGLRAFPGMIGGGIAVFVVMLGLCVWLLARIARRGRRSGATVRSGAAVVALVILLLTVFGVDSVPRRVTGYLTRVQQSAHFADTPQGRAVADLLDLHPVSKKRLVAAPGKNLVFLYLESLERIYWDPKVFPGLAPNLDRLRKQGLDFSGLEQFAGAGYTIAGMFASQCGVPLFSSPFAGLDAVAGNDTDTTTFHPKIACLGDVLHKAGYTQVYMAGAPIVFSHKGLFYRLHGYDEALGLQQLEAAAGGKLPKHGWGLYDSALFPLLLQRYRKLEGTGKPFNLATITLDTHPPDGRPSPGCPKYSASDNSMLQAVHCTDYLVGKFIDALSKEPDWKNTVVVIMSDHLMMRNDAEPLYPKGYHRQPALLVLNAGKGVRPARMYHMDIAPTVLDLLGVRTNATFIAGQDRSTPNAQGSELVDNAVTDAVLRKALWSRVNDFKLCKKNTLIGWTPDGGFDVGGRELRMSYLGQPQVGIHSGQVLDFFIDNANAKLVVADADKQAALLQSRGDASVLTIRALQGAAGAADLFSVNWIGRDGGHAHIADAPRLAGLTVTSPDCAGLIQQADAVPAGKSLDLSRRFEATTAKPPLPPKPPAVVDFTQPDSASFENGFGWLAPESWGSWAIGDEAALGFTLREGHCNGTVLHLKVDPYLPPSRPKLDTQVWVNGKLATTWHFVAPAGMQGKLGDASDDHQILDVDAPIDTGGRCAAKVVLRLARPGAASPPYPKVEDQRPLQLRVLEMRVGPKNQG